MKFQHLITLSQSRGNTYDPEAPLKLKKVKSRLRDCPVTGPQLSKDTAGLVCDLITEEYEDIEIGDIIVLEGGWTFAYGAPPSDWLRVKIQPEKLIR